MIRSLAADKKFSDDQPLWVFSSTTHWHITKFHSIVTYVRRVSSEQGVKMDVSLAEKMVTYTWQLLLLKFNWPGEIYCMPIAFIIVW